MLAFNSRQYRVLNNGKQERMIRDIENGFEVLTNRGKFLRSYHVTPAMDLVKTTNKIKVIIHSSSSMKLIKDWLEIYRHQEMVKDHLNNLK